MADLVALDMAGGAAFVRALRAVWDRGDAAFPLDHRLPMARKDDVLRAMRPAAVIDPDGRERTWGGDEPVPVADGDALVMATSGTTGEPKGVLLTHDALRAHAAGVHARLDVDRAKDRWLACLPVSHMGGLGVVVRSIIGDVPLDVLAGFDARTVESAPTDLGSTLVSLVPTALDRAETDQYRWVVLGGAGDRKARPDNVVHTYGLTETGGGVYYSNGGLLTGTEISIVQGEIRLRGPSLLRCYRDGTDPRTHDGWLPTGDIGSLDADGTLTVQGRRGDMIVTGGENVWPAAVEAALARHPRVVEVAVAGRPDPEWGHVVVAHVVPRIDEDPPTLAGLRALAKEHLPAHCAPKHLVLTTALPKTSLGKVRRDLLES